MQKKTSLTELFYLTLLISALRPPDNYLLYRRERYWNGPVDTIGSTLAENICFNSANRFLNSNGAFCSDHYSTKSSVLLDQTHQALEYINSLGRYSQPAPFSSNFFAYPVSRGLSEDSQLSPESTSVSDETAVPTSTRFSSDDLASLTNDISFGDLNLDFNFDDDLPNLNLYDLDDDFLGDSGNFFESTQIDNTGNNDSLEENNDAEVPFGQELNVDALLADTSVMFPILDEESVGDVNDLFGELELLLANETENYGQEWQSSAGFYSQLPNGEPTTDYSIYDPSSLASTEGRPIENCSVYEPASTSAQLSTPSASFSNNNGNFGAVLYSSLTTLTNGSEHLSGEGPTSGHLGYTGDINDLAYMSNVSNLSVNNVSTSDCFYNGYLPDELPISEVAANASQFSYPSQQPPCYPPSQTSISHGTANQFPTAGTEDCFDKNSDSAVSSMSSDRVHSSSENEWAETSSESSYNGDFNNENKFNASAQKKYRLFGKNKNAEPKNPPQEYYIDYGQGHNYMYSTAPVGDEAYPMGGSYYATVVGHNHTYAQPAEVVTSLAPVSDNIPNGSWASTAAATVGENNEPKNGPVKKAETPTKTPSKSNTKKAQQQQSQQQSSAAQEFDKKDNHLNRDEKRARALKIPISTSDIINLPIDEFNERLTKYELTEMQLSLIRDIRRRGKNKVAAQNCRKRKLDQIMGLQTEVDTMFNQKDHLENQYNQLMMLREMARDKYAKLYQFVVEASSSRQHFELTASPPGFPDKDSSSNEVQLNDNVSNSFAVSSNLTSTVPVSSYGVQGEYSKQE